MKCNIEQRLRSLYAPYRFHRSEIHFGGGKLVKQLFVIIRRRFIIPKHSDATPDFIDSHHLKLRGAILLLKKFPVIRHGSFKVLPGTAAIGGGECKHAVSDRPQGSAFDDGTGQRFRRFRIIRNRRRKIAVSAQNIAMQVIGVPDTIRFGKTFIKLIQQFERRIGFFILIILKRLLENGACLNLRELLIFHQLVKSRFGTR